MGNLQSELVIKNTDADCAVIYDYMTKLYGESRNMIIYKNGLLFSTEVSPEIKILNIKNKLFNQIDIRYPMFVALESLSPNAVFMTRSSVDPRLDLYIASTQKLASYCKTTDTYYRITIYTKNELSDIEKKHFVKAYNAYNKKYLSEILMESPRIIYNGKLYNGKTGYVNGVDISKLLNPPPYEV